MNRALAILYIVFCFEVGVLLLILPWLSLWHKNFFVENYVWVSVLARDYYLRGAISGIGLADIWLAVFELWRLRRELGLVSAPPSP
jgi:hypothetical protein